MPSSKTVALALLVGCLCAAGSPPSCPASSPPRNGNATVGMCANDFTLIGGSLEAVHSSAQPPTGLAVDRAHTLYLTYPRNTGATAVNVVRCTSFSDEQAWPSAAMQHCERGQDASTCFVNVQNVVLDADGRLWVVDSGIPPGASRAVAGGAKIMAFSDAGDLQGVFVIPEPLYDGGLNANDVRINTTLGTKGVAFITDESDAGSVVVIDLDGGKAVKRLFNTTVTRADPKFVGSYNGEPIYSWNGTRKSFVATGADGIALASGNVYWGVLGSRRYYFVPQHVLYDFSLSDEAVLAAVQDPGELGSEQAGLTADDKGRVYITASEQNAIYYVDTQQQHVTDEVNGVPPGGSGPVRTQDYVVKTLLRNALVQHADSAAILDGWLYFCTNQLSLSPGRQYKNVDKRRGPFGSYRLWVGAGPAV